ncbi:MAG: SDR family oxidoreductase [Gammaproteobacteria bacterium AqS3]|nr:SDR family oxidoreductase [Gammaproteobacteria bacterium AqS3]
MAADSQRLTLDLSRSVRDRTVLVTGAASGIGRATVELLAGEGAHVLACDLAEQPLRELCGGLSARGGSVSAHPLDVADAGQIRELAEQLNARQADFPPIYGLVNNAGIPAPVAIDDADFEGVWERALAVMLSAHVRLVRALLPAMRTQGIGRIVNIASTEGLGATNRMSPYVTAKTGVVGLTRALAVELGAEGITVNCICPGPVRTGMTAAIPEEHKAVYVRRRVPLRRYAEPEELAHAILHLLLPASSFINGAVLPVDGGLTIKNA